MLIHFIIGEIIFLRFNSTLLVVLIACHKLFIGEVIIIQHTAQKGESKGPKPLARLVSSIYNSLIISNDCLFY